MVFKVDIEESIEKEFNGKIMNWIVVYRKLLFENGAPPTEIFRPCDEKKSLNDLAIAGNIDRENVIEGKNNVDVKLEEPF